jgi:hypothetical protein
MIRRFHALLARQDVLVEQSSDGTWWALPQASQPGDWPLGTTGETAEQALSALVRRRGRAMSSAP